MMGTVIAAWTMFIQHFFPSEVGMYILAQSGYCIVRSWEHFVPDTPLSLFYLLFLVIFHIYFYIFYTLPFFYLVL